MEKYIDTNLSLELIDYLILVNRENLCWLMNYVTIKREDAWRDQKFQEIKDKITELVLERETILKCIKETNVNITTNS